MYEQMTLTEWMDIKEKIRKDMNSVKHAFVRIGYNLRRIRDDEMYKQDGYDNLADFAREELGIGASMVSRLISINEKYSIDGYSETLLPQYENFKQASLVEMLSLPETDLQMVTPTMAREDIRELRRFNKAPEGPEDNLQEVVREFCRQNRELINELYQDTDLDQTEEKDLIEAINPSGNRIFKKGLFFLSFTDEEIKIKEFGGQPQAMTYKEFVSRIMYILGPDKGESMWERCFGWPEGDKAAEEPEKVEEKTEEKPAEQEKEEPFMNLPEGEETENEAEEDQKGPEGDHAPDGETGSEHGSDAEEGISAGEVLAGDAEVSGGSGGYSAADGEKAEPETTETGAEKEAPQKVIAPAQFSTKTAEIRGTEGSEEEPKIVPDDHEKDLMEDIEITLKQLQTAIKEKKYLIAEMHLDALKVYIRKARGTN